MTCNCVGRLLNQTVTIEPVSSVSNGDATYGTPATYPARVDFVTKRVLNQKGVELPSIAVVYIAADIGNNVRITLPSGEKRTPLQVNHLYNGAGEFSHCEVYV